MHHWPLVCTFMQCVLMRNVFTLIVALLHPLHYLSHYQVNVFNLNLVYKRLRERQSIVFIFNIDKCISLYFYFFFLMKLKINIKLFYCENVVFKSQYFSGTCKRQSKIVCILHMLKNLKKEKSSFLIYVWFIFSVLK